MTSAVDDYSDVGLEDFDSNELSAPRLKIDHGDGVFRHSQSNEGFDYLDAIILGVVKQRTYFDADVDTDSKPRCKSPDSKVGFPRLAADIYQFPWAESNFNPADYPNDPQTGVVRLPCEACIFSQWGAGDGGKRIPPPCSEQYTLPILYNDAPEGENANYVPAMITFQKTGIKPVKDYITNFVQRQQPVFSVVTRIKLEHHKRGTVKYSTPVFEKGPAVPPQSFPVYRDLYLGLRGYLHKAPRVEGALQLASAPPTPQIEAAPEQPVNMTPPPPPPNPVAAAPAPTPEPPAPPAPVVEQPQAPAPAAPPPPPAPVAPTEDPWANTEPVAAQNDWPSTPASPTPPPVAAPVPAAPPASAPPAQQPVVVSAPPPFEAPAPVPPPVAPAAPPAAPAPAPAAAPIVVEGTVGTPDEDELPF